MRTLIVGDVHGCIEELERLVEKVELRREDALVSVGDLVGKGPAGHEVIRYCMRRGARVVLGNHDAFLLAYHAARVADTEKPDVSDSLRKLEKKLDPAEWTWLAALPRWLHLPEHGALVVHGGLVPGVPLEAQDADLLLTLRSIRTDGTPSRRVDDGDPWASKWPGPEHVYFGHDAVRGLQRHPFATGLDTGCVYGGRLTGMLLPQRELVSTRAKRVYAEPGRAVEKQLKRR